MGALPIALGLGAGSISRRPLGYAIVGGVFVSTLLTLYLVPVVYTIFDRLMRARASRPRGSTTAAHGARRRDDRTPAAAGPAPGPALTPPAGGAAAGPAIRSRGHPRRSAASAPSGSTPTTSRALGGVVEADWARKAARLAFFVPAVTASLDYTKYSKAFFNIGTFDQSSTSGTFNAAASYEIFSARKFTELGRSQAELEAATADGGAAALRRGPADRVGLLRRAGRRGAGRGWRGSRAARAEEQLRLARARVASGAAVQSDSLSVRLELIRARVELLRLESTAPGVAAGAGPPGRDRRARRRGPAGLGRAAAACRFALEDAIRRRPWTRGRSTGRRGPGERSSEAELKGAAGCLPADPHPRGRRIPAST